MTLDAIVSSPLVRTRQTAEELIPAASNGGGVRFCDLLAPEALKPRKLSKFLAGLGVTSAAVVGHDPDLPAYLGWLLGVDPDNVPLAKGGAALVTFDEAPSKGDGRLAWAVTPDWFMTASPEPTGG
jgi:phosphohistidine phosphatase SixA